MLEMPVMAKPPLRPEGSVRFALREATADLHTAIDARFSGDFARDTRAYADFLCVLARSVLPLECLLERAGIERLLTDWPARRRSVFLVQDLKLLGCDVPVGVAVPPAGNDAWLLGAAYVLEGSRLGGKVLLRRVMENPDPVAREATHYLRHGMGTDLWPRFIEQLEGTVCGVDDAIAGARAAFGLFAA
jgi:heme oxygenase